MEQLIYSSFDWEWYRDEARDYFEDVEDVDDDMIDRMAMVYCYDDLNNFYLPVLENYFNSHPCYISGSIGRWDGRSYGGTVTTRYSNFLDLLDGCQDIEIKYDENALIVRGFHHDGTNYLKIRELNDRGYAWYQENAWDRESIDCLQYNFNSHRPKIEWCL